MRTRGWRGGLRCLACAVTAVALTAGCAAETPTGGAGTVGGRSQSGTLTADLTGTTEVPGPGDPDGGGSARLTLDAAAREVCFEIFVVNIEPAFAAHIHEGATGVEGPIAVGLAPPTAGSVNDCVDAVDSSMIVAILDRPSDYYVNVHNQVYAAGAVRGQLTR